MPDLTRERAVELAREHVHLFDRLRVPAQDEVIAVALAAYRLGVESRSPAVGAAEPLDMVLHCPACGMQHIDAPEAVQGMSLPEYAPQRPQPAWTNPPHRSHLCHGCGHIWRPADVPTNGVASIKTTGKADSPLYASPPRLPPGWVMVPEDPTDEMHEAARRSSIAAGFDGDGMTFSDVYRSMLSARPHPPVPVPNSIPLQDLIAAHEKDPVKAAALAAVRRRLAEGEPKVPLTEEQISNRLWEAEWPEVMLSDFVRAKLVALVRSVERAHGIHGIGIKPAAGEGEKT